MAHFPGRRGSRPGNRKNSQATYKLNARFLQVSRPSRIRDAADAAARIKLFRQDLDRWHGRPAGCRMPQAPDYGLALACCSSANVLFGRRPPALDGGGA